MVLGVASSAQRKPRVGVWGDWPGQGRVRLQALEDTTGTRDIRVSHAEWGGHGTLDPTPACAP